MIKLVKGPNTQWHNKMMTKIKYFLGILAIIFILVSTNHYFPFDLSKKAAFTSRNISLDTREGLLEPPKPIKLKNPPIAPQLTSEYPGQEMVKGKQRKIILHNRALKFIWNSFVFLRKICCNLYQRCQSSAS